MKIDSFLVGWPTFFKVGYPTIKILRKQEGNPPPKFANFRHRYVIFRGGSDPLFLGGSTHFLRRVTEQIIEVQESGSRCSTTHRLELPWNCRDLPFSSNIQKASSRRAIPIFYRWVIFDEVYFTVVWSQSLRRVWTRNGACLEQAIRESFAT